MSAAPDLRARLLVGARALGLELAASACDGILAHLALLEQWNRAYNLVAASTLDSLLETHVLDSLSAYPYLRGPRLMDVGTGAGFPGLPLAIVTPDWHWLLLDSNGKKARFCTHVAAHLALGNVEVAHIRAERFPASSPASTVVARAVASLAGLVQLAAPVLAGGGRLVALKGRRPTAELAAAELAGLAVNVHRVVVPGLASERHIVTIDGATGADESNAGS